VAQQLVFLTALVPVAAAFGLPTFGVAAAFRFAPVGFTAVRVAAAVGFATTVRLTAFALLGLAPLALTRFPPLALAPGVFTPAGRRRGVVAPA